MNATPRSPALDFGVQSYCFRGVKDNAEVARLTRRIGVDTIELCGVHADFNDLDRWRDVVALYRDEGVRIVSIGVQTLTGDLEKERDWFECLTIAGAKHMAVHFQVDSFREAVPAAAALAEEFDVRLAIHCHGGYRFGGSPDVMEHLLTLGGPRIGVCLDTAWCMQIGPGQGNPVQWVEKFAGRVYGLHYKDFLFEPDGAWRDVVVGRGNLDLPALLAALEKTGFDGYAVTEYEGDVDNPVPALTECVRAIRDPV